MHNLHDTAHRFPLPWTELNVKTRAHAVAARHLFIRNTLWIAAGATSVDARSNALYN